MYFPKSKSFLIVQNSASPLLASRLIDYLIYIPCELHTIVICWANWYFCLDLTWLQNRKEPRKWMAHTHLMHSNSIIWQIGGWEINGDECKIPYVSQKYDLFGPATINRWAMRDNSSAYVGVAPYKSYLEALNSLLAPSSRLIKSPSPPLSARTISKTEKLQIPPNTDYHLVDPWMRIDFCFACSHFISGLCARCNRSRRRRINKLWRRKRN